MSKIFYFGEKVKEYDVRVLNEREVRAASGILFLFAIIGLFNVWFIGNFYPIKIFIIAFLVDFLVRLFVNPKYSPTLILGRFFVKNQEVEYVGAPQKKFAWFIGLVLVSTMFVIMIIFNFTSLLTFSICVICLLFLFFESVFGICVGCKLYNLFNKETAKLCPGGVCKLSDRKEIQKVNLVQILIFTVFIVFLVAIIFFKVLPADSLQSSIQYGSSSNVQNQLSSNVDSSGECVVSDILSNNNLNNQPSCIP